jgi:hypothetical protein
LSSVAVAATAAIAVSVLGGCPTVDLGDVPPDPGSCRPDPAYFEAVLWPEYIDTADPALSCVAADGCHDRNNGRSALRLNTDLPIDFAENYNIVTRFLNCATPESSALFTKPLAGVEGHGGDDMFNEGSPSAMVFLEWFNQ